MINLPRLPLIYDPTNLDRNAIEQFIYDHESSDYDWLTDFTAALHAYATQAIEQALASQWQDIATAPKVPRIHDGSHTYCESILVVMGNGVFRARWWSHSDGAGNFLDDGGSACYPSHWMALPAPPAIASQGETK